MHQHVDVQRLLAAYRQFNFLLHCLTVGIGGQFAAFEGGASTADGCGLREGAYGGGGQQRQFEPGLLRGGANGIGAVAAVGVGRQRGQALLDFGAVDQRAGGALLAGVVAAGQFIGNGVAALLHAAFQHFQLIKLLHREGQPGFDVDVELGFRGQVEGRMQQRATGSDPQALAQIGRKGLQTGQHAGQIGAPDVATVDDAGGQYLVLRPALGESRQLQRRAHQVQVQAGHRQALQQFGMLGDAAEVGGQQQPQRRVLQLAISGFEGGQPFRRQIQGQDGFVDLHPFHFRRRQRGQHVAVGLQQGGQQGQLVQAGVLGLAQPQQRQRPQQHRLGAQAQRLGFSHLRQQALRLGLESGVGMPFRHQVVVVGVEPFSHFQRRLAGIAARQLEILLGAQLGGVEAEARRHRSHQQLRVQHVVVQGEVAYRGQFNAGAFLQQPMALAQFTRAAQQRGFVDFVFPVVFQQGLQFALGADAGKAEQVQGGHGGLLRS